MKMVIKKYTIQSRNAVKKQFKPLYCKGKLFLEKNLDQLVKLVISDAGDQGGGHPYRHGGRGQHRRLHGRPLVHGEEPRPRFPQGPKLVLREYTGKPFRNLQKKTLAVPQGLLSFFPIPLKWPLKSLSHLNILFNLG